MNFELVEYWMNWEQSKKNNYTTWNVASVVKEVSIYASNHLFAFFLFEQVIEENSGGSEGKYAWSVSGNRRVFLGLLIHTPIYYACQTCNCSKYAHTDNTLRASLVPKWTVYKQCLGTGNQHYHYSIRNHIPHSDLPCLSEPSTGENCGVLGRVLWAKIVYIINQYLQFIKMLLCCNNLYTNLFHFCMCLLTDVQIYRSIYIICKENINGIFRNL